MGQAKYLGVGLAAVAFAAAGWLCWLFGGATWAHGVLASQVELAIAAPASAPASAPTRAELFAEYGQTGDAFGSINALLTALAGAFVLWAALLQREQLKQAKGVEEAEKTSRQLQEFEALFFRMLDLTRELVERIDTPGYRVIYPVEAAGGATEQDRPGKKGAAALDFCATRVDRYWEPAKPTNQTELLRRLVHRYEDRVYMQAPSSFGPYFRLLYQTFKHIAEAKILSVGQRTRYANIARGQISEGAVLLLALNGLGVYGYKFIEHIEEFGLLEHLHPAYKKEYEAALLVGYHRRAFCGSGERSKSEMAMQPPKLPPACFSKQERCPEDDYDGMLRLAAKRFDSGVVPD